MFQAEAPAMVTTVDRNEVIKKPCWLGTVNTQPPMPEVE